MDQLVAIITGAGRGIGRAAAEELARRGYRLTLVARTEKDLQETHKQIGGEALVAPCDVTDPTVVERVVAQTHEKFGRIDARVNNAGTAPGLTL
jgi:NADP-dependent 3-hydroxy acid dehydrogenase YdfG